MDLVIPLWRSLGVTVIPSVCSMSLYLAQVSTECLRQTRLCWSADWRGGGKPPDVLIATGYHKEYIIDNLYPRLRTLYLYLSYPLAQAPCLREPSRVRIHCVLRDSGSGARLFALCFRFCFCIFGSVNNPRPWHLSHKVD